MPSTDQNTPNMFKKSPVENAKVSVSYLKTDKGKLSSIYSAFYILIARLWITKEPIE